ncbi:MAG: hypothetical protein Q4D76_11340 [Oscillospiraceae bacterium]|nr:hypothetical protein [Oscillospiraceae bacterium]
MSIKKSFYKKILAAATAFTMIFAATGCGESTAWIAKCEDMTLNSGVYIFYQTEAYSEATSKLKEDNEELDISDIKLLKTMTVEGTDITQWINSHAEEKVKIFMAVNKKFDELGLSLSAEDESTIENISESYWQYYAENYEKNGIGKDSFRQIVEFDYKKEAVFLHYYGEGGEKECADPEIGAYLEGNYSRVKTIKFDLKDSEGTELSDDEKKDVKKMAEDYLKKANSGSDFDELIEEYQEYKDKLAEEAAAEEEAAENEENSEEAAVTTAPEVTTVPEETAETEESDTDAETSEAETNDADAEETAGEEAKVTTAEEEEEAEATEAEGEEEADVTTAEEEEEAEVTTAEETEEPEETEDTEADPYANENIYKKGSEEDGYQPSEKVNNAVFNDCAVDGKAVLVEDEDNSCIYVIKRLDILERKDFFEGDQRTTILTEMFMEEFEKMAVEWADAYTVSFNSSAVKRYDPFNIQF